MTMTEEEKKKKAQEAISARLAEEQVLSPKHVRVEPEPLIDITKPHPADPNVTYQPPLVNGVRTHDFPLNEKGVSPYSGLPPVYYNGVLISSQHGNSWDGSVTVNLDILQEPLETSPGSWVVPNALIGGIPENIANFMGSKGASVPDDMVMSREEHTDRMNAIIDQMPKRTQEESEAHFYRVAYEQITGIHKQEAAKRNALAGIMAPDASVQQPIEQVMNMARALVDASAPHNAQQPDTIALPPTQRTLETARAR